MTNLGFLHVDAALAPRSPLADATTTEVRDGWEVAAPFGDAATVLVEDRSPLGKLEVETVPPTPAGDLGSAVRRDDHWWCPVTPDRALALCDPGATTRLRDALGGLDLTTAYGALAISGPLARETFARFCALDLRDSVAPVGAFRPGSVARTPGFVLREADERFLVLFGAAYGAYVWQVVTDVVEHLRA